MWRYKVASEASVSGNIQEEKTESPFGRIAGAIKRCVYLTPPGWKTLKGKNSRKCMMNLGIAMARSRIGTKNVSG